MDNLLEKKLGVNADDARDSVVEPLVPMFGGEIAAHPQIVRVDPVVPADGACALVVLCDCLWLGNLDSDLVWRCLDGFVKLAAALARDVPPLSDAAC
jgi:hypothetical protein